MAFGHESGWYRVKTFLKQERFFYVMKGKWNHE